MLVVDVTIQNSEWVKSLLCKQTVCTIPRLEFGRVSSVLRERVLCWVLTDSRHNTHTRTHTHTHWLAPLPGSPNNFFISSSVYPDSPCQSVAYNRHSYNFITIVHQLLLSWYGRRLIVFIVQINTSIQILLSPIFHFALLFLKEQ